jgi:hypothetical protein
MTNVKEIYCILFQTAENEKSSKGTLWNHMYFVNKLSITPSILRKVS